MRASIRHRTGTRLAMSLAVVGLLAVTAACGDDDDDNGDAGGSATTAVTDGAPEGPNPFGGTDAFCEEHTPPEGTRSSFSPGVTPDSITLVATNIDPEGLARLGIELAPAHEVWAALAAEINEVCGGINGRQVIIEEALGDPLSTDPVASTTATCIKATEDLDAFMVVNSQLSPPMARCVTDQHETIGFIDGPGLHTSDDMEAAEGRLLSIYPTGDASAAAFLSYAFDNDLFEDKKVMVLGTQRSPSTPAELNAAYMEPLEEEGVDAYLEVLPCVGAASNCRAQIPAVVSRAKANGVNLIVTSHLWSTGNMGIVWKNMQEQGLQAPLVGPNMGAIHSDSVLPGELANAGAEAARYISELGMTSYATDDNTINGAYRVGAQPTAFGELCLDLVNERMNNSPAWTYSEDFMNNNFWLVATNVCRQMRGIARALWSLGNDVTTERAVAALAREDNRDKVENTPSMRDVLWYSTRNTEPERTVPVRFAFPCTGSAAPDTTPCMIPAERPIRAYPL